MGCQFHPTNHGTSLVPWTSEILNEETGLCLVLRICRLADTIDNIPEKSLMKKKPPKLLIVFFQQRSIAFSDFK